MKAVTYSEFGGAEVLHVVDRPEPHVGPDTVLVKVVAAGLNPVDYKIREGYLEGLLDTTLPAVPGWDVAGVVVKPGLDTPELAVGDEVLAYVRKDTVSDGTLAEYVAVPVRTAAKKPAGLSFDEAAALPLAGLTALQTIRRAGVTEGQTVLVHAAAGGVGLLAVQIARHLGARVIGTASEGNHDVLRELGAEPVTYGDGLAERVRELAPDGVDVVLDLVGGVLETTKALLAEGGRHGSITDGTVAEAGGLSAWVRPDSADLQALADLADAGALTVPVAEVFALEDAAKAYALSQGGHVRGKIAIEVSS